MFVMTLFSAFGEPGGSVAHFAHLGGLLAAFAYLKLDWRTSVGLEKLRKTTRRARRLAIVPRTEEDDDGPSHTAADGWSREDERLLLDEVDRVLDKISEEGMASLTADERRVLDEAARRHRTN